jgi:transcription antitermination factor NusG
MEKIINQVKESEERLELDIPYKEWDKVKLKSDELWGIEWEIIAIDTENGEVKVKSSLMWRETIVNVPYDKIQKILS